MHRRTVFDSPAEAALDGWPEAAHAEVIAVEIRGDRAEVLLDTDPSYPYWVYCQRAGNGWRLTGDGNGPCVGWDDPTTIQWAE